MMNTKRLIGLLLAVFLLVGVLGGCNSTGGQVATGEKVKGEWALPPVELTTDTCTVLVTDGHEPDEELEALMLNEYGLTMEYVEAPWNERETKLAALVAANDAPDVYGDRAEINLIVSDLIQPIDDYIDLDHKYYDKFRDYYDTNVWNGSHYGLYNQVYFVNTVYYNKKMFEDAGLETPWELYEQGKWDWNAFLEAAEELTQDTNDDGETDVYGVCFNRPVCWPYVTGEPFAYYDQENMALVSNMNSEKIAGAMNFIYDLLNVKNLGYKSADTIELFANGSAAMMPQDSGAMFTYLKAMCTEETLDVAPLPRDPNGDTHYARDMISAYSIPVGAKNPGAAVALNACYLYLNYYKEGVLEEKWDTYQSDYNMSDELVEHLRLCMGESTNNRDNIKGVQEHSELLGYNCTWETIYWGVPWATALANRKAEMDSLLAAATERVLPRDTPIIEDFEAITGGITTPIVTKLLAIPGGSTGYELYLDAEVLNSGNYGAKMYYDVSDVGWGGFKKDLTREWTKYNALSLWLQGDGSTQTLILSFVDGQSTTWSYNLTLEGETAQTVVIPFADFSPPDYMEGLGVEMDLSKITSFQLVANGEEEHSFNVDDILVVSQ